MRQRLFLSLFAILFVAFGGFIAVVATGTRPALGLDLQGGISVTQQPKKGSTYSTAALDLAVERIRDRVDSLGVAEPEILRQGDTIVVNLPGVKNQQQAVDLVQVTGQVYLRPVLSECQVLQTDPTATTTADSGATGDTAATGDSAVTGDSATVDSLATSDTATATTAGGPSRPVSASNTTAPATTTTTTTTSTTSAAPTTTVAGSTTSGPSTTAPTLDENGIPVQESDPAQAQLLPVYGPVPQYCYVGQAQGTGEVFQDDAGKSFVSGSGWGVTVSLRDGADGEDVWNNLASQCYSRQESCPTGQIAIELDGVLQSVATVQTANFKGSVQITGSFEEGDAQQLADVINSGSLPVSLELQSVQNVSPTLGKDSLRAAWISGLVGVGLVLLFMALYYRTLGLIVLLGLSVSGTLLWSVISLLSRTEGLALSLSGIAGIIVSVGVTVDSYVVFFERLKDEVRAGRTLRNSAQRGFTAAWRTIVIADLVSLIGALVLWYLTVGAVRGFAFFLGLSTACDLIVSYFFTRPMVMLLARTKWMERRKVMGIEVAPQGGAA